MENDALQDHPVVSRQGLVVNATYRAPQDRTKHKAGRNEQRRDGGGRVAVRTRPRGPHERDPHRGKRAADVANEVGIERAEVGNARRKVLVPGFRRDEHPRRVGEGQPAENQQYEARRVDRLSPCRGGTRHVVPPGCVFCWARMHSASRATPSAMRDAGWLMNERARWLAQRPSIVNVSPRE